MKVLALSLLVSSSLPLLVAQCPHEAQDLAAWDDPDTWEDGVVPTNFSLVEISSPILLSGATERLGGVTIVSGGRLIFDPTVPKAMLSSDYILIDDEGSLEIGSKDCLFEGEAEILLTGIRDGMPDETTYGFGQKFLGVAPGGSLEIHGSSSEKVSWTRLAQPLNPKPKIFETNAHGQPGYPQGLTVYEFDNQGNYVTRSNANDLATLTPVLESLTGDIIIIAKQVPFALKVFNNDMESMQTAIETALGITGLTFASMVEKTDPYLLVVNRDGQGSFLEDTDTQVQKNDPDGRITDLLEMEVNGIIFRAQVFQKTNRKPWKGKREIFIETYPNDYFSHEMVLQDATGWQAGDKIVVASTDFNFDQAEEFEITSVEGTKVVMDGHITYVHYADTFEGVDMRAEVGLLTRNVKIHGEMEPSCYTNTNKCSKYEFDNFGGHTKAVEGFAAYNIEGAEIYHMGQTTVLGSYPIHFHMAGDTTRNGERTAVQHNSIHHTFSRCVTIHGSHNVDIINNVAYDHYGHCFFLEDGGEKGTYYEHNLGLTTRQGELTESDDEPSTFWITSPLTTMRNNAAAGSDNKEGVGIWYLFPDEPVGPSEGLGLFGYREAKYTPIDPFKDNVAHSNGNIGLALFRRLGESHEIIGCSTYSPRVDPKDEKSELSPVVFDGLIAYKNRQENAILRAEAAEAWNFRVADSKIGITLKRNMLGGYQRIKNATIVGESPNVGEPERMRIINEDGNEVWTMSSRSVPWPWNLNHNLIGVKIDAEGPSHLQDIKFTGFSHGPHGWAAAIYWVDEYRFHNGATTSAKGLIFDFEEPADAYRMYEKTPMNGIGDASIMMRDLDGSLTGTAGQSIVQKDMYFSTNSNCQENSVWNLEVCNENFAKFYIWPMEDESFSTFITNEAGAVEAFQRVNNLRISYTARAGETYQMHWEGRMPHWFNIRMSGLEVNDQVIVGFCLPSGAIAAAEGELHRIFEIENKDPLVEAASLADLSTTAEANIFVDGAKDMVYRKYVEEAARGPNDLTDCIGGLKSLDYCPMLKVKLNRWIETLDFTDGDCRGR